MKDNIILSLVTAMALTPLLPARAATGNMDAVMTAGVTSSMETLRTMAVTESTEARETRLSMGTMDAMRTPVDYAQRSPVDIRYALVTRMGDKVEVVMQLGTSGIHPRSRETFIMVPMLVNGEDTLRLKPIGIYSRQRWLYYQRNPKSDPLQKDGEKGGIGLHGQRPETTDYHDNTDFRNWMKGASLQLGYYTVGCCGNERQEGIETTDTGIETTPETFVPHFVYETPEAEARKARSMSAKAYIDFPVSDITIHPDYHDNRRELAKIEATIDSVALDSDISVKSLTLKGFASPEGPYDNNVYLAEGRTRALRDYLAERSGKPFRNLQAEWEPEDWDGLRAYLEKSDFPEKYDIFAIMDREKEPDRREWIIKSRYPDLYKVLLSECYPFLRHTEYTIDYEIKAYDDVKDIRRLLVENPAKLSLREIFLAAKTMVPGSREFDDAFETAVRLFPDDPTANLNGANAAMSEGRLDKAAERLAKAGDSAKADYARGILAALQGRYDSAAEYFSRVQDEIPEASEALGQLHKLKQD